MDTTDPRRPRMGTVLQADGTWVLRYERTLAHPRDKVWRALTESEHLQHWLPCDIVGERRAGAAVELPFWPAFVDRYQIEEPVVVGRISVWQPPEVFEWWWDGDRLRWELEEQGAGTRLLFTTWIGDPATGADAAAGYHICLDRLEVLLDTGHGAPLEDHPSDLEAAYEEAATTSSGGAS
jgi:uncharacterized protein YndB with AHSA1/START domain